MECCICCCRHDAQRRPFLCPVDARNRLYEVRMRSLQLLLENEDLRQQIKKLGSTLSEELSIAAATTQHDAQVKTQQIIAAADSLRVEIQSAKLEIQARRAALSKRKSELASISSGLLEQRKKQQKDVERSSQMLTFRWSQSAEDMAGTRAFLCKEVIRLYGLRRSRKGSVGRYEYQLGRLPIVDMLSMEASSPEVISTSLAHVAHIVVLVAHYLSIRLPAEVTLPHRDYPQPTIFNLAGSYQPADESSRLKPAAQSMLSERKFAAEQRGPRPRPLHIDKPLSQLAKEDPSLYSFFLEGVTLLAYDVAWLCCSQGVNIGEKGSLEEVCNIGKNLYSLFSSAAQQGVSNRAPEDKDQVQAAREPVHNWIGRFSHGTTYYFLGGAEGSELVKTFKLPSPMKLADKLKKKLLGASPAADWEVLDNDEWKDEDRTESNAARQLAGLDTKTSLRPQSRGWMKVKNR